MEKYKKYFLMFGSVLIIWKISHHIYIYPAIEYKKLFLNQVLGDIVFSFVFGLVPLISGFIKNKRELGIIGFITSLVLGCSLVNFIFIVFVTITIFRTTKIIPYLLTKIFIIVTVFNFSSPNFFCTVKTWYDFNFINSAYISYSTINIINSAGYSFLFFLVLRIITSFLWSVLITMIIELSQKTEQIVKR